MFVKCVGPLKGDTHKEPDRKRADNQGKKESIKRANARIHTRRHRHVHTHTHTDTDTRTHALAHARANAHAHARAHTHTPLFLSLTDWGFLRV